MWISDKLWQSLSAEQKGWVHDRGRRSQRQGAGKRAFELERAAAAKLEKLGVKIVADVDKTGFQRSPIPIWTSSPSELGPHAEKIKTLIRSIN